jgi:hypothetical protein
MNEHRHFERFDLGLPSRITIQGRKRNIENGPLDLTTENISSGGAFFYTDQTLPEGTEVVVDIVLPLEKLKKAKGTHARVNVEGVVLRAGAEGMAVRFNKNFNILPVGSEGSKNIRQSSEDAPNACRRSKQLVRR